MPRHHRIVAATAAALVAACGGGGALLALVPVIGPIGGQWAKDVPADSPTLQAVDGEFFNVDPLPGRDADNYPTESNYAVGGDFASLGGPCATALGDSRTVIGQVAGPLIVLTRLDNPQVECLRGRFVDARTVEVDSQTRYRNTTPQFALDRHEWVNADDSTERFKFNERGDAADGSVTELSGCRRSGNGTRTDFSARLLGYDAATNVGPRITEFTVGGTAFGIGEFASPREIEFGRNGGPRLLLRRALAGATPLDCAQP